MQLHALSETLPIFDPNPVPAYTANRWASWSALAEQRGSTYHLAGATEESVR